MSDKRFYVYIISSEGTPIYVGKGTGTRCMNHMHRKEMAHIAELSIRVIYMPDEEAALSAEAQLIDHYGIDNLLNKVRGSASYSAGFDYDEYVTEQRRDSAIACLEHRIERCNVRSPCGTHRSVADCAAEAEQNIVLLRKIIEDAKAFDLPDVVHVVARCESFIRSLRSTRDEADWRISEIVSRVRKLFGLKGESWERGLLHSVSMAVSERNKESEANRQKISWLSYLHIPQWIWHRLPPDVRISLNYSHRLMRSWEWSTRATSPC